MRKRVVVTGASSGIGAETALLLAERGHSLVLAARRKELLEEVAGRCRGAGAEVRTVVWDACAFGECTGLAEALGELEGGEPVLVNNAGVAVFGGYLDRSFDEHWGQVSANLGGAMAAAYAVLPTMRAFGSGLMVNVLSIGAETAFPGAAVYGATKAGLRQFGRCLSEEFRREGLRVTNLLPGATDTPLWDSQAGHPPKEQMLSARAVGEAILGVVELPGDRVVEEVRLTPPFGVL